jgi:uncharacterized protein (DUF1778 family)
MSRTPEPGGLFTAATYPAAASPMPDPCTARLEVRYSERERDLWRLAAEVEGVSVSELVRRLVNAHVDALAEEAAR